MRSARHPSLAIVLALILVLTAQSMAVARGAAAAVGQMELCVGQAVVTVYTDADGNPTAAPHVCPDCAFAGLQALVVPASDLPASLRVVTPLVPSHSAVLWTGQRQHVYLSRAPPVIF